MRRSAAAAPVTRQASASGLRAIQVSSAGGKAASAAGCAQNEETESVDAQENAATPPGTGPRWAHGWPPVPGHPLPKCLPPTNTTTSPARNSADGPSRPRSWPRAIRAAAARATGSAASSASTARTSIAPDITTVATTAAVSGTDHCQPIVSCDHMAPPKPRKTAAQQASEARLARARFPARSVPSGAKPHRPASVSLATIPPRTTSAVRAGDLGRSARSAISSSVNSAP